jgi:hypothetical protein
LELFGEKNRLGRGSDLGHVGGNLCLWGPERFFSVVRNADCTYSLFGRALNLTNPRKQINNESRKVKGSKGGQIAKFIQEISRVSSELLAGE